MSSAVVVRYQTTVDSAGANRELVRQVYAELHETKPDGLRYITVQLADGTTFLHLAIVEADENPLSRVAAFHRFQQNLGERVIEPPTVDAVTVVASYGF